MAGSSNLLVRHVPSLSKMQFMSKDLSIFTARFSSLFAWKWMRLSADAVAVVVVAILAAPTGTTHTISN